MDRLNSVNVTQSYFLILFLHWAHYISHQFKMFKGKPVDQFMFILIDGQRGGVCSTKSKSSHNVTELK